MDLLNQEEPSLEKTGPGFSVLNVKYKNRYLYSKYDPLKSINKIIENLEILPNSLILINSPVLWYGLEEIVKKANDKSKIIAIEYDIKLYNIAKKILEEEKNQNLVKKISFFHISQIDKLENEFKDNLNKGFIKRLIPIDFSSGKQFFFEQYENLKIAIQDEINVFWKNRVTLSKFGKNFSKNIILNAIKLKDFPVLDELEKSINKSIIVCGAGESLDDFFIDKNPDSFYIIAVDAAYKNLCKKNIIPDAVVCLESQCIIQKAFIGEDFSKTTYFSDLCSRSELSDLEWKNKVFFLSEFAENDFIKDLKNRKIINSIIKPMGSVGLVAVYIATKLRANTNTKIFITGLDFSYSAGKTHAKNTPATINQLLNLEKLKSLGNYSCFDFPSFQDFGKSNKKIYTSKVLKSYAKQFVEMFSNEKNIYDLSSFGLNLNLKYSHLEESVKENFNLINKENLEERRKSILEFYIKSEKELIALSDLLSNGEKSQYFQINKTYEEQILELIKNKDYLWFHFPDGINFNFETSFLKRIKAELPFFIKQFSLIIKNYNL